MAGQVLSTRSRAGVGQEQGRSDHSQGGWAVWGWLPLPLPLLLLLLIARQRGWNSVWLFLFFFRPTFRSDGVRAKLAVCECVCSAQMKSGWKQHISERSRKTGTRMCTLTQRRRRGRRVKMRTGAGFGNGNWLWRCHQPPIGPPFNTHLHPSMHMRSAIWWL